MHTLKRTLSAALLAGSFAFTSAHAAPPSDASINTLLTITQAEKMVDTLYGNMEQTIRQAMQQATAGKTLTAEQARVIELAPARLANVLREEVTWAKLEPSMVQIYRETFDQNEIDGLIAFYQSPVGKAFIDKMPIVMQRSMDVSQAQMQAFLPKMQAAMTQVMKEAKLAQ